MGIPLPKSKAELQDLVDIAEGALALEAARLHGLIEGGPDVDGEKCAHLLEEAKKRGIHPRKDAIERFVLATLPPKAQGEGKQEASRVQSFDQGVSLYKQFYQREGHGFVTRHHIEKGFKLGIWIKELRASHKAKGMSLKRKKALQKLLGWEWGDPKLLGMFYEHIKELRAYIAQHGHSFIPSSYKTRNFNLGFWASKQRLLKRKMALDLVFVDILESTPGWTWESTRDRSEENEKNIIKIT